MDFSTSYNLARHKITHSDIKPYECDYYESTFSQSSSLVKHKRINLGEKPYLCEICQKSLRYSSSLTSHNKSDSHIKRVEIINAITSTPNNMLIVLMNLTKQKV